MLTKRRGVQPSHTLDLKFAEIEKRRGVLLSSNLQGDEKRKGDGAHLGFANFGTVHHIVTVNRSVSIG